MIGDRWPVKAAHRNADDTRMEAKLTAIVTNETKAQQQSRHQSLQNSVATKRLLQRKARGDTRQSMSHYSTKDEKRMEDDAEAAPIVWMSQKFTGMACRRGMKN